VAATGHREELTLGPDAVRTLVGMGPHSRHLDPAELAARIAGLPDPVRVTVSVDVTTWTPTGRAS
jgi:23S rRNA (guanine745-N1)-methyltransferase